MTQQLQKEGLKTRYLAILEQIRTLERACARAFSSVRLCVVSKQASLEQIRTLYAAGARDFGENRVHSLEVKREALRDLQQIRWHFIGHLQSRKIPQLVEAFPKELGFKQAGCVEWVHSIHDLDCLKKLEHHAQKQQRRVRGFLQVNLSGELSKQGMSLDSCLKLADQELLLNHVEIAGVMTMAPLEADDSYNRSIFMKAYDLQQRLSAIYPTCKELSMGMSRDWREAVACGATWLRLGSALFLP